jgi:hypothetical protein
VNTPRFLAASCALVGASAVAVVCTAPAAAHPSYLTAFQTRYPTSTLPARMASATGSSCNLCHHPTDTANPGNCYRESLITRLNAGRTIAQAIQDIETADSDQDGVNNATEILAPRAGQPGQIGYNPGLIGATGTDPCGAAGPVSNQLETPPAACYANCDSSTTAPVLNVSDFSCFLNNFAAASPYANCDGSTTPPEGSPAGDWMCRCKPVGGMRRQIPLSIQLREVMARPLGHKARLHNRCGGL